MRRWSERFCGLPWHGPRECKHGTIEAGKVGGRGAATENGQLLEGEDKTRNKMFTTEVTGITESIYEQAN